MDCAPRQQGTEPHAWVSAHAGLCGMAHAMLTVFRRRCASAFYQRVLTRLGTRRVVPKRSECLRHAAQTALWPLGACCRNQTQQRRTRCCEANAAHEAVLLAGPARAGFTIMTVCKHVWDFLIKVLTWLAMASSYFSLRSLCLRFVLVETLWLSSSTAMGQVEAGGEVRARGAAPGGVLPRCRPPLYHHSCRAAANAQR